MQKTERTFPNGQKHSGFTKDGLTIVLTDKSKGIWLLIHDASNTVITFVISSTQAKVKDILADLTFFRDWTISGDAVKADPSYLDAVKGIK